MDVHHNQGSQNADREFLINRVLTTGHKSVALLFLWLALLSVVVGMALSVAMRWQLAQQEAGLSVAEAGSERHAAVTLLHGSLMVFFVLTAAPQCGFGYFFLPLQIGARELAFPRLSALSFWLTAFSLVGIIVSVLVAPDHGATIWLSSVTVFSLAMIFASLNISVTTIEHRAKGMTLSRLPITVWAWLITAILSLLIFSILTASSVFLLCDRLAGTHFFHEASLTSSALPILWQRWFWFFAQSEVYVAMLPCFGIVTHFLSVFSRKPLWSERAAILALCAVGLFGFCIWGEHMFASGLNPYTPLVFSLLASSLGIPAVILLVCWFATLWGARVRLTTAMLFALGFLSLFLSGGMSGLFLSRRDNASRSINDTFVTGHFHLVMGVAAAFAILAALFFWFPKMFGRQLNETLGKIHFWLTFAGVFCLFMTMHWLGLISSASQAAPQPLLSAMRTVIAMATFATVAAQLIFFWNFLWSLFRQAGQGSRNPWRATTLEWFIPSPPPEGNFGSVDPVVHRGAYEFGTPFAGEDFVPQHLAPEQVAKLR